MVRGDRPMSALSETIGHSIALDDYRMQLAGLWGAVIKHRWTISAIIAVCLSLGLAITLLSTPQFTAETVLQVDRAASKIIDVEGLQPTEALTGNEFLETQVGILRSESLARRTVQTLKLVDNNVVRDWAGLDPIRTGSPDGRANTDEDEIVAEIMARTTVRQEGLSRLITVSFRSPDAALSAKIANELGANYQVLAMERRFESSAYARKFLEERIAQAKIRLEESEKALVAYASSQQIVDFSGGSDGMPQARGPQQSLTASDLVSINSLRAQAQGERIRAEQRWQQARAAPALSLPEVLADPTVQNLLQQRATLSASYEEKLKVYAPSMPEMLQLKAQLGEVERQLAAVSESIKETIRTRYEVALKQERSLSQEVEVQKGAYMDLRERNIQNTILQREVDTNRTLYDGLLQRYKEVGVAGGVEGNNISVVDLARPPQLPSSPKLWLNIIASILFGLVAAALTTLLLEVLDESLRTPDDVQVKLGLPAIGVIPILGRDQRPADAILDPKSPLAEAYASTRTAIQFSTSDGIPQSLLVTSGRAAEGKSTTSFALARSFASLGLNVLLVDADLRNPSIHRVSGLENRAGLSNILIGSSWQSVVHATDVPTLAVVTSGPLPPNPSELLSSAHMMSFLSEASVHFGVVILDGPPVIGLADAPILAARAEATVVVVEAGAARRSVVRIALRRLVQARARILGVVLTKFNSKSAAYGYGYGYGYAYSYDYGENKINRIGSGG